MWNRRFTGLNSFSWPGIHMVSGTQRALLLLSGGIDSPVAGWLARQRGVHVDCIHFANEVFAGNEPEYKSRLLAKKLGFGQFYFVDISSLLARLAGHGNRKYYFVLMKRAMMKIAEQVALRHGYDLLVTGESLGQVSSQTLKNLAVIDKSTRIKIVRPLLCLDKVEIIHLAEKIGSFDLSKGKEHCDALATGKPSTQADEDLVLQDEALVQLDKLVAEAVQQVVQEPVASMKEPEAPRHLKGVC